MRRTTWGLRNRGVGVLLLIIAVALLSACEKEVKRQSEDSFLALEAFDLTEAIRRAYVERDFNTVASYCTEAGYREIEKDIKRFDRAELEFTPRWVGIEDDVVRLKVSWKARWALKDRVTEERGLAVFQLEGRPLKLSRVLRDSPFKYPDF